MIADYQQPDVWVGHIEMQTDQLEASEAFMIALGMRAISKKPTILRSWSFARRPIWFLSGRTVLNRARRRSI